MPDGTRVAVRIVLLDQSDRVLLFEGRDLSDTGDTVRFWFTAGGGVDEGESFEGAAERELLEETGQSGLSLIGPFHSREFDFLTALSDHGWTELEQAAMTTWRWWSTEELVTEGVHYFPENLVDLVQLAAAQV